jgi:hypothetical protein
MLETSFVHFSNLENHLCHSIKFVLLLFLDILLWKVSVEREGSVIVEIALPFNPILRMLDRFRCS